MPEIEAPPFVKPFNFQKWIEENRALLKPPVGNKLLFEKSGLIAIDRKSVV